MKLSICIISLHSRKAKLAELLDCLTISDMSDVEVLVYRDDGLLPIGAKRNKLVNIASGRFIVHIDDDDLVDPRYLPTILAAIDRDPFIDAILVRGRRTENGLSPVEFDYRVGGIEGEWIGNVLWHSPCHLCPIRADIAKMIPFPEVPRAEDLIWLERLKPHVRKAIRAGNEGEVLYHYRWDPHKRWGT
jgi:glycosyltransferase involved in cell wall biosynthesis